MLPMKTIACGMIDNASIGDLNHSFRDYDDDEDDDESVNLNILNNKLYMNSIKI